MKRMMKIWFIGSLTTLAMAQEDCPPEKKGLAEALNNKVLTAEDKIKLYASKEKGYKIINNNIQPTSVSPTHAEYKLNYLKLKPNECVYLQVPKELWDKPILFVNLGHRQMPEDNTGYDAESKWDNNPGLTTVQVNEKNDKGEAKWRYWNGMASGNFGAKFAEVDHMELEGLYEWYKNGHSDIDTNTQSTDLLHIDGARLCSIGKDTVTLGSLAIKVSPQIADEYQEVNISPSNKMGDSVTAKGRSYGSRSDSLLLNSYAVKPDTSKLPKDWKVEGGVLSIPAKKGMELTSVEVSIGDQKADGTSGRAKLSVNIRKVDGSSIEVIKYENVPPEGVLIGAPFYKHKLEEGDKIEVKASTDEAFVSGIKLGYKK